MAVHPGQGNAEEDEVGLLLSSHLQALLAVCGLNQPVVVLEELNEQVAIHLTIFDDQDFLHDAISPLECKAGSGAPGRVVRYGRYFLGSQGRQAAEKQPSRDAWS